MAHKVLASVIIPNWNGKHLIGKCLDALKQQSDQRFEVIVVENGSHDGSAEYIAKHYPDVIILAQPKNLGFAGGVNVGLKYSKAKYKVLLNNDAQADTDWLKELILAADQHPTAFSIASKTLEGTRKTSGEYKIDSTGDQYSVWGFPFPRGRGEVDRGQFEDSEEIFSASGGAVLFRASLLAKLDYFDEDFFAYYEDVDISFRARLAGYHVMYAPKSIAYHLIGATSGGGANPFTRFLTVRNSIFLYTKCMPAQLYWKYLPKFLLSHAMMFVSSVRKGLLVAHLKGFGAALLLFPKKLIQRHAIQGRRQVSAAEIDGWLYKELPPIQRAHLRRGKHTS